MNLLADPTLAPILAPWRGNRRSELHGQQTEQEAQLHA